MAHVRQDAASGWSLGPDMTSALPTLGLLRVNCNTGPTRLLFPSPTHHHHPMQASAPTYIDTHTPIHRYPHELGTLKNPH
jgi:hypothetical protein